MVNTPADEETMRFALSEAARAFTGRDPSPNLLAFMLAQTAIETAHWRKIQNQNVGNITVLETADAFAWRPPWFEPPFKNERDERLHALMLQGKAPKAFRAYGNLREGAADYVKRLHVKFPEIIVAAEKGDARKVAHAINKAYCPSCFGVAETRNLRELADRFGADQTRPPVRAGHFGMWFLGGVGAYLLASARRKRAS